MAVYWNLGLVTRTREAAEACAAYFRAKQLVFEEREVALEVWLSERSDGWVIGVWPQGMSYASPYGNDPRLTEDDARLQIAAILDQWLCDAPPFVAGYFGGRRCRVASGDTSGRARERRDQSGVATSYASLK